MIGLFIGIESYNWSLTDFDNAIAFCKKYGIGQLIVKIYEITQGEWYSGLGGAEVVVNHIKSAGLDVLPYGYFYGSDVETEVRAALLYLSKFGKFCLNMEDGFNGNPNGNAGAFATALTNHPGEVYISTWADPEAQNWVYNITVLDPICNVWMPEAYSDTLVKAMYAQYPKVQGKIWPTFHIVNTPAIDSSIYSNFTLWEYQMAQQNGAALQDFIISNQYQQTTGERPLIKNNNGTIVDEFQVYQVEQNESFLECGPYAIALLKYGGVPTLGRNNSYGGVATTELIDRWADKEYGIYSPTDVGSSIDNMHSYITDAVDDYDRKDNHRLLHYWDIDTINDTSDHNQDIDRIIRALNAGYPVVVTILMSTVIDQNGNYVYPGVGNYHIVNIVGHTVVNNNVCWLVNDTDTQRGNWPYVYQAWPLFLHWATIIQMIGPNTNAPWLSPIPNGDPLTWAANFNAQAFTQSVATGSSYKDQQFTDVWNASGVSSTTDIFKAALFMYTQANINFGTPRGAEIRTVDWSGNAIQYQQGNGMYAEWHSSDRLTRFYDNKLNLLMEVPHV